MAIRPGKCYSQIKNKPFTRLSRRKPRQSYVKSVPASKIHHFEVGTKGDYGLTTHLISNQDVQIRSNSLEAIRVTISKNLARGVGEKSFFMKILVYPHHIIRENPMATGAGADRYSSGMRRSYGKPIGQAARVRKGQALVMAKTPAGSEKAVKMAFKRGTSKLSGTYRLEMK